MKKILITGGAGYIGSHIVKIFLEKGYSIVVLDNFSRGYHEPMEILKKLGNCTVEKVDLLDLSAVKNVFKKYSFEAVLHFAALCLVNESVEQPERYMENNVVGTENLLRAMTGFDVRKIIFSSTCAVYGEAKKLPMDELHPTYPTNPYGDSKLKCENLIREYGEKCDIQYVIFRYFNVCGAASDGVIGDSKRPSQLLMQNAVRGAMGIEEFSYTCGEVDTPDHTPIRDFIDVEDLAEAHFLGYRYLMSSGVSDTFNLGSGKGYSVKEIISEVEKIFGVVIKKSHSEPRKGEYALVYTDPSKAKTILGFFPKKTLVDSISSLRKWYLHRPQGYLY